MDYIQISYNSKHYPKRLLKIKKPPKILYAVGDIELLNKETTLGIIGSRDCTQYGIKYAHIFSKEISKNDICIISGMAIGIDAASHIASINQIGKTIAVLGSGLNNIYPEENEWLFHKILENGGCIITEYEPNIEPDSKNFPKRNRIVSGLSDAILVVEAEYRSGTSITAKLAKEEGKTIYCIPSNLDSAVGIGTNKLIKQGAILVTNPSEIIENLEKIKIDKLKNSNKKFISEESIKLNQNDFVKNNKKMQDIDEKYISIYKIISEGPIHINDICKKENKNISQISPILTMLELQGYIEQITSNQFKIKEE